MTQRDRKTFELNAANHGVEIVPSLLSPNAAPNHRSLPAAVTEYLEETRLSKKRKTHGAYTKTLTYFQESCTKAYLEDIDRRDLLMFSAFLRDDKDHGPRSVRNRFMHVLIFLKAQGIRGLVGKNDWPRYVQEEPEVYEQEELDTLFAACDAEERLWFEFFLMTGMRDQEVSHCSRPDVNFRSAPVSVTHKPAYGWTPKAYEEREIPIPEQLMTSLQTAKTARDTACPLIFPVTSCRPRTNFLRELKAVAERAGLKKEDFWLHKFRSMFATWHLWNGADLRSV